MVSLSVVLVEESRLPLISSLQMGVQLVVSMRGMDMQEGGLR